MTRLTRGLASKALGPVLLALCLALTISGTAAMKIAPYLQAVTASSVYVLVECDTTDPVTVEYGLTTAYGNKAITQSIETTEAKVPTHVHNVKLTGLRPNTTYHYRAALGGVKTADYTFGTAVEPGTNYRFVCMGDFRSNGPVHDQSAAMAAKANPRFLVYGGDLCDKPDYNAWKAIFFRPNQLGLIAKVPFFNTPGNHEQWHKNTEAFTQAPESPSGTQAYYSFDYGDIHFLSLNTELPCTPGSPQYEFAAKDLAATKGIWKIVSCHKPAFSGRADKSGEFEDLKAMVANVFEPNKVDLVVSGHNHYYQHNLVNGVHHLTVGSSAAPLYDPVNMPYTIKSVKDYCHAIVDVTPASLHIVVCNNAGTILDTIDLVKKA